MFVRIDCTNTRNNEERYYSVCPTTSNKPRIKLPCLSNGDDGAAGDSTATPKTTTYGRYIYNSTATTGRCGSDFAYYVTLVVVSSSSSTVRLLVGVVGEKSNPVTRQKTETTVHDRGRRNNLWRWYCWYAADDDMFLPFLGCGGLCVCACVCSSSGTPAGMLLLLMLLT